MAGNVTVDISALDRLAQKLITSAPADVRESLRKSVAQAGQMVADDAGPRTSPRVASTITVKTWNAKATIRAGNDATPEAVLLEGEGTPGQWRHPLFGNRKHWYSQDREPYLHPALAAKKQDATDLIVGAAADAVRSSLELT